MLKAISSFMLSLLVLLSNMGFYVDHMVCGMSGEHKVAINRSIEKCSDSCDRSAENSVNRTCCDYDSFYFKEDVPAIAKETSTKSFISAFRFTPMYQVFTDLNSAKSHRFQLLEEPDILLSVERHVLFQTFLV